MNVKDITRECEAQSQNEIVISVHKVRPVGVVKDITINYEFEYVKHFTYSAKKMDC